MARIAYIDHSFHIKTASSCFLPNLLVRYGHEVDFFWCDRWKGGQGVSFASVAGYDAVVMFQIDCASSEKYINLHPCVTFVPMLDSYGAFRKLEQDLSRVFYPFSGSKVLSFSRTIHGIAMAQGAYSFPVRYFQPPVSNCTSGELGLRGFFWLRKASQISWPMVRGLIGETPFASLHLHIAPDPGSPDPLLPTEDECRKFSITMSRWFTDKSDFFRELSAANVFFASRTAEGIGQSFLEAMSRGHCVVAPDNGTMNEYIINGVNGILYDPENIIPLDFSNVSYIGDNAFQGVVIGYDRWVKSEKAIVDFIVTNSGNFYKWFDAKLPACAAKNISENSSEVRSAVFSVRMYVRNLYVVRYFEFLWLPLWKVFKRLFSV